MVRKLLLAAAAATLAAAPVAAQAAPARTPAPVAGDAENLRGGWIVPIIAFAVITGLLVLLFDDNNETPTSP